MAKLMVTCKEASRLTSEGFDGKLSVGEWLTLRMHLMLCEGCSRVNRQLQFLRRAMLRMRESAAEEEGGDRG